MMPCPKPQSNRSAFTLVELLIASSIMAGILVAAYLCLQSGLSSQEQIESRGAVIQTGRVAMDRLTADLRAAMPLTEETTFVGMDRTIGEIEADNLDFATYDFDPRSPRNGDISEVSYFVDRNEEGEVSLFRRRDSIPDDEPLAGGRREAIAPGLRGLRFEYFDGWQWYDEWGDTSGSRRSSEQTTTSLSAGNLSGMPEAVRVTMLLASESGMDAIEAARVSGEPPIMFQTVVKLPPASQSGGEGTDGSTAAQQRTRQ